MQLAFTEKLGYHENDNYISYYCGPFRLIPCIKDKSIIISYNSANWGNYVDELINTLVAMLEITRGQIVQEQFQIKINNLSENNIVRYFTYTLILV